MEQISCFGVFGSFVGPQTCMQCRQRKVRCDKRQGTCGNCERLSLPCYAPDNSFQRNDVVPHNTAHPCAEQDGMSRKRLRGARACTACKIKKTRCSGTVPSCVACIERGRVCVYPSPKRRFRYSRAPDITRGDSEATDLSEICDPVSPCFGSPENPLPTQDVHAHQLDLHDQSSSSAVLSAESPTESPNSVIFEPNVHSEKDDLMVPTQNLLDQFLSLFFEVLYPMPSYAFFHPRTTIRRCNSRITCSLSLALCSVASLHVKSQPSEAIMSIPYATIQERAREWVRTAEQSIWLNLERPSISRLQALLLIINYHMETAHFQRAFMLVAIAARYATAMRLNHERQRCDRTVQEVSRRILWTLKIVERYFSVGLAEFDTLPLEVVYIEFPREEEEFLDLKLDRHHLRGKKEGGAYRIFIQLEVVRRDIMRLTRNITLLEEPLENLAGLIDHHRCRIAGIEIPPSISQIRGSTVSEDPCNDRWLSRRVLTRISWHQTHCDLYRIILRGYSEAAPSRVLQGYDASELAQAEELCSHHAMCIIDILTSLNQYSDQRQILEFDTAICAYHATRLVLYISRLGNKRNHLSPEFALSRAQLCLAGLKRFFFASALVAPMIRELENDIDIFSSEQQKTQQGRIHSSAVVSPRYRNGELPQNRTIGANELHNLVGIDESLSDQYNDGSQKSRISSAAQIRERLAVHSLLRRADFANDEGEQ